MNLEHLRAVLRAIATNERLDCDQKSILFHLAACPRFIDERPRLLQKTGLGPERYGAAIASLLNEDLIEEVSSGANGTRYLLCALSLIRRSGQAA